MPDWDQGGESGQAHDQTMDRRSWGGSRPRGADTKGLDRAVDAGFAYAKNPNQANWDAYQAAFNALTPAQKERIRPGGVRGGGSTRRGGGGLKGPNSPPVDQ